MDYGYLASRFYAWFIDFLPGLAGAIVALAVGWMVSRLVFRLIKTALKKHEVDSMKPLDETTEIQILNTLIKQRREAADMFRKGERPELADKEEAELKLVESYMPAAPSELWQKAAMASIVGTAIGIFFFAYRRRGVAGAAVTVGLGLVLAVIVALNFTPFSSQEQSSAGGHNR